VGFLLVLDGVRILIIALEFDEEENEFVRRSEIVFDAVWCGISLAPNDVPA
jgi:hypothetical protein